MLDNYNYHRDSRTWDVATAYTVVESGPDSTTVQISDDAMESLVEEEILTDHHTGVLTVPSKFVVCHNCAGCGTMVDPRVDAGGLSPEDFDEDPDFREDYFGGRYDIACSQCKGQRVVPVLTFPERIREALERWESSAWDSAAESAAERAMGA